MTTCCILLKDNIEVLVYRLLFDINMMFKKLLR